MNLKEYLEIICDTYWLRVIEDVSRARYLSEDKDYVYIHNRYNFIANQFNKYPQNKWPIWEELVGEIPNYIGRVKKALKMSKKVYYECIDNKVKPIIDGIDVDKVNWKEIKWKQ